MSTKGRYGVLLMAGLAWLFVLAATRRASAFGRLAPAVEGSAARYEPEVLVPRASHSGDETSEPGVFAACSSGDRDVTQPTATEQPDLIAPGASMEQLSTGHRFTEGPAVYSDGSLFFSDVQSALIHRLHQDGTEAIHRRYTGGANGLYFDADWQLVACEMGAQRLSIDDLQGAVRTLVDSYAGNGFNAPNDLWIHPGGGLYFTDPDFRGSGARSSVYYLSPGGELAKVIDDIRLPNGVIGTPDGEHLYVTDYSGTATWRYRIEEGGALSEKQRFSPIGGDGMTLDDRGNVYLAAGDVLVFGPQGGDPIESIDVPEVPSNVTFGGLDGKTLYVTSQTSVYSIEMNVKGAFAPSVVPARTATPTEAPSGTASPGATDAATPTATASRTATKLASATGTWGVTPSVEASRTPAPAEEWVIGLPILYRP